MRFAKVLMFFGVAFACGGSTVATPPVPEWKPGTRLRPVVITNGVVRRFDRFHDTVLDVDCTFRTLSDGALHCAPETGYSLQYADASCTQRIVGFDTCGARQMPYALTSDYSSCAVPEVIEIGDSFTPTSVYEMQKGTCTRIVTGNQQPYSRVKRTVPPSELVSGIKTKTPRGSQLFMSHIEGADGSRQPYEMEGSPPRSGPCTPGVTADGQLRCVPDDVAHLGSFSGPTCSTPTGAKAEQRNPETCGLPPLAIQSGGQSYGCDPGSSFFEVGAKVTGPVSSWSGACGTFPSSPMQSESFYLPGGPIADAGFAKVRFVSTKETPLARNEPTVATGETLERPSFWDAIHQTSCEPSLAADGKVRCIPTRFPGDSLWVPDPVEYSDPECKTMVLRGLDCAPPPIARWFADQVNGCYVGFRLYPVGPSVKLSKVYSRGVQGSTCVPSDATNGTFYSLGPEVTSEFIELHDVVE